MATTNFSIIHGAFEQAGVDIKSAGYSFTAYSLNTPLSFRFSNEDELIAFLNLSVTSDNEKIEHINQLITEAGLDPDTFFYVNFYKPKVAEI